VGDLPPLSSPSYRAAGKFDGWTVYTFKRTGEVFTVTDEINVFSLGIPEVGMPIQPDARTTQNIIRAYNTSDPIQAIGAFVLGVSGMSKYTTVGEMTISGGISGGLEAVSAWGAGCEAAYTGPEFSNMTPIESLIVPVDNAAPDSAYCYGQLELTGFIVRYETPLYIELTMGFSDDVPQMVPRGFTRGFAVNSANTYYLMVHGDVDRGFRDRKRFVPDGYVEDGWGQRIPMDDRANITYWLHRANKVVWPDGHTSP
jgi:hypothetical protein